MRKKLTTLRAKQGHSFNGAPRQMLDEALYLERQARAAGNAPYDSEYSGWSHATRPRDQAISLRRRGAGASGASGASGRTG
jgi:hypothetical protein